MKSRKLIASLTGLKTGGHQAMADILNESRLYEGKIITKQRVFNWWLKDKIPEDMEKIFAKVWARSPS